MLILLNILLLLVSFDKIDNIEFKKYFNYGGLAQLARAPALHAGGHRFDSDILHYFIILCNRVLYINVH